MEKEHEGKINLSKVQELIQKFDQRENQNLYHNTFIKNNLEAKQLINDRTDLDRQRKKALVKVILSRDLREICIIFIL